MGNSWQFVPRVNPMIFKTISPNLLMVVSPNFSSASTVYLSLPSVGDRNRRSRWRANAATSLRVLDAHVNGHNTSTSSVAGVEIPVTCYQIIGVPNKAEKDQIVKSVMDLKNSEIEDGYSVEAVTSRLDLLMGVRDKLLFEPEYAGDVKDRILPKSTLRIPWAWLPGALCLLQEVGEEKLVLEIGRAALQYPDAKEHVHDLLLSMALAECAIAKTYFEKNKVSQGFEALARAQSLLRSKVSLAKMNLHVEIEESLEGRAPACTLELLAMPQIPDNVECRRGAIAALRELLSQGLDVEASCQVQDWACFFSQALGSRIMAIEIVDLIPWDSLASTRKNKKSLDSQNQRVVIDFDCFYTALMAHITFGFSSRQTDLISKAKLISECLMASDGVDLKLEEAFCLFLLGQGSEAEALERLQEAESKKNSGSRSSIIASIARKVYLRGGIGVGGFRRIYGGSKRSGSRPRHFGLSSGSVARHILQQLESISIIEIDPKGGRKITSSGREILTKLLAELVLKPFMILITQC